MPAKKKQKVFGSPLSQSLLDAASRESLKRRHALSVPYNYIVLDELCDPNRMRLIHDEAKSNMTATFKETDLFKVFQTGDLATINESNKKVMGRMPHLLALRESLYSPEFRSFIGEITGCDDLTDRVDCSANAYTNGCHLLCHDDVIGTRRVSYIIYLTDPDDDWKEEDGGALELYPLDPSSSINRGIELGGEQGVPLPIPTAAILPKFNSMAIFKVQVCLFDKASRIFLIV